MSEPAPTLERQQDETLDQLAQLALDLQAEQVVRLSIYRIAPSIWEGVHCRGHLEEIDWDRSQEASELVEYVRQTWGGTKFKLSPKRIAKSGKWEVVTNVMLEIPGAPRDRGRPVRLPPREDGREDERPRRFETYAREAYARDAAGTTQALNVVQQASAARAEAAESAADARVKILDTQLDGAKKEIDSLRDRTRAAEEARVKALDDHRRDLDGARTDAQAKLSEQRAASEKSIGDLREAHRQESERRSTEHRQEIDRIREENRKEVEGTRERLTTEANRLREEIATLRDANRAAIEVAKKDSEARAEREIRGVREDWKDKLDRIEGQYKAQIAAKDAEIGRLHTEVLSLREKAMERTDPMKQIEVMGNMAEKLKEFGADEKSTAREIVDGIVDLAPYAPSLAGSAGMLLRGVMGMPAGGAEYAQGYPQQPAVYPMRSAPRVPGRRAARPAVATPQSAPPAQAAARVASAPLAPVPEEIVEFKSFVEQLEFALGSETAPEAFARGLLSTAPTELIRRIAAQEPATIVRYVEQLMGPDSVVASARGRQYLGCVLDALRTILAAQSVAPPAAESERPTSVEAETGS